MRGSLRAKALISTLTLASGPAAFLASCLVSCGGSPDAAPKTPMAAATAMASATSTTPIPAPAESARGSNEASVNAMLARTLKQVEQARGLRSKKPVPGMFLRRDEMIARVKDHVHREVPAEAIVREGRTQQLLGVLPEQFDYEAEMYAMLEDQLAGFYAPEDGTMYMAKDLEGDMSDATVFHELVHALQDQTWDLRTQTKYKPGEGDRSFSRSALAEGDATSAMLDPLLSKMGGISVLDIPDDQAEQLLLAAAGGSSKRNTPAIMQRSLVAPYALGLRFVNGLRRKGGWKAVDQAWANPPTTSEQLMHPEKYAAKEAPLAVNAPNASALDPGFKESDQDTLGEMGLVLLLEQWAGEDKARALAAGWGGDRGAYFQKGDEIALAWRVDYDADVAKDAKRGAKQTASVLEASFTKSLGKPAIRKADFVCFDRPHLGPISIGSKGKRLTFTAGPAKPSPTGFSSTATCASVKSWAASVGNEPPIVHL